MLVGNEIAASTVSTFTVRCKAHTVWLAEGEKEKLSGPQCAFTKLYALRQEYMFIYIYI